MRNLLFLACVVFPLASCGLLAYDAYVLPDERVLSEAIFEAEPIIVLTTDVLHMDGVGERLQRGTDHGFGLEQMCDKNTTKTRQRAPK